MPYDMQPGASLLGKTYTNLAGSRRLPSGIKPHSLLSDCAKRTNFVFNAYQKSICRWPAKIPGRYALDTTHLGPSCFTCKGSSRNHEGHFEYISGTEQSSTEGHSSMESSPCSQRTTPTYLPGLERSTASPGPWERLSGSSEMSRHGERRYIAGQRSRKSLGRRKDTSMDPSPRATHHQHLPVAELCHRFPLPKAVAPGSAWKTRHWPAWIHHPEAVLGAGSAPGRPQCRADGLTSTHALDSLPPSNHPQPDLSRRLRLETTRHFFISLPTTCSWMPGII
jgi:hypothetical protein